MKRHEQIRQSLPACVGGGAEVLKEPGGIRYYVDFPGGKGGRVDVSCVIAEKLNSFPLFWALFIAMKREKEAIARCEKLIALDVDSITLDWARSELIQSQVECSKAISAIDSRMDMEVQE